MIIDMILNQFVSEKRRSIFEDLIKGQQPREGTFDQSILDEAQIKGLPQMGTVRFASNKVFFEFIYSDIGSNIVLVVEMIAPERIVFLPVPNWVIESIWQGEVSGSYHFEKDALDLVEQFRGLLDPEKNSELFGQQQAKRRE